MPMPKPIQLRASAQGVGTDAGVHESPRHAGEQRLQGALDGAVEHGGSVRDPLRWPMSSQAGVRAA
jgi:hypothetical protein